VDLKASTFKALEQSAESARGENHRSPDERPNDVGEQQRLREGRIDRDGSRQGGGQGKSTGAREVQLEQEQEEIRELAAGDREVGRHAQAQAAVGGNYARSPVYESVRAPDEVRYAVA